MPRPGVVPRFADPEVVALGMAAEAIGIDSEFLLFSKLKEYRRKMPHLIFRWQYNDRHKPTVPLCQRIRQRMARRWMVEDCFCIDSKPIVAGRHAPSTARWAGRTRGKPPPTDTAPGTKSVGSAPQSASFHPNRSIQPHRSKPANAGLGAFLFLLVAFLSLLPLSKEETIGKTIASNHIAPIKTAQLSTRHAEIPDTKSVGSARPKPPARPKARAPKRQFSSEPLHPTPPLQTCQRWVGGFSLSFGLFSFSFAPHKRERKGLFAIVA